MDEDIVGKLKDVTISHPNGDMNYNLYFTNKRIICHHTGKSTWNQLPGIPITNKEYESKNKEEIDLQSLDEILKNEIPQGAFLAISKEFKRNFSIDYNDIKEISLRKRPYKGLKLALKNKIVLPTAFSSYRKKIRFGSLIGTPEKEFEAIEHILKRYLPDRTIIKE